MARTLVKKRLAILPSIFLAALTFIGLSLHVSRQFDLHHTGLLATKLVAVGEGYRLHSEVFSQYGPLLTWTQVPFLALGQSPIITLLLWTVVVTSLTAFLIADLGRIAPPHWQVKHNTTLVASALWVILDPTWRTGYLAAWSSLLVALMIVSSLYLLAIAQNTKECLVQSAWSRLALVSSGFLIGLSPFARINAGLAAILVLMVASAVVASGNGNRKFDTAGPIFVGLILGIAVPLAVLAITDSLSEYWEQAVVGPFYWAQLALEPTYWNTWSGLQDQLVGAGNRLLPLLLLIVLSLFLSSKLKAMGFISWSRIPNLFAILLVVVLAAYMAGLVEITIRASRDPSFEFSWFDEWVSVGLYRGGLYFLVFGFLMLAFFQLGKIVLVIWRTRRLLPPDDFFDLLLWGFSLSLLIQIIPTTDHRHVWWGLPLAILALLRFLRQIAPNPLTPSVISLSLLLVFFPATVAEASRELSKPLTAADDNSFGSGVSVAAEIAVEILDQLEISSMVASNPALTPTYYMVRDGSVAGIDGVFRSSFAANVWWAKRPSLGEIVQVPWSGLVIDSWVARNMGYESIHGLIAEIPSAKVSCVGEDNWGVDNRAIYCVILR